MAVRGEDVATSIEAHVREAVERMVGEIRSSIEDVRVAVDQQLNAALQSVQADVNSLAFPQIHKSIGELTEGLASGASSTPARASSSSSRLKRAIQAVERGKSQVDILNALLEQSVAFGSRAALLILRGETFSGWKGVGFQNHGGDDEAVKRFNAAPGLISELDSILKDENVIQWDGANISSRLGVTQGVKAILVPMVIKDKVAAAVFVDVVDGETDRFDVSSIELLVFTTGLLIDTLTIRKRVPSPSLSQEVGEATVPPAPPKTAAVPRPATSSVPAAPATPAIPPAPAPPTRPVAAPTIQEDEAEATVSISAEQMRQMMAASAPPSFNIPTADDFSAPAPPQPAARNAYSTTVMPVVEAPQTAPPPPPAPEPAPPSAAPAHERPSTQYVPPAGVGRGGTSGGAQSEEAKKHDEARRFARLLVSEIKLYNETKVDAGRKNRDLYERLKEDIDRSRQMYDERIGEDVRKVSNYFYDELVRILADGNPETLGL